MRRKNPLCASENSTANVGVSSRKNPLHRCCGPASRILYSGKAFKSYIVRLFKIIQLYKKKNVGALQVLIHRWSSGNSVDRLERTTEFRKAVAVAVSDSILEMLRGLRNPFIPTGSNTQSSNKIVQVNLKPVYTI